MLQAAWLIAVNMLQAGQVSPDSGLAVQEARDAQARFERGRRSYLPVTGGGGGRCDARIGRFCYWYDEADTTLPAEPVAIRRERERLLAVLGSAHGRAPASDWVVGQWVRYLTDHDLGDSAAAVATRCGGTPWWCSALHGLALHTARRFEAADSSFATALRLMPEPTRCQWTDWRLILAGSKLLGEPRGPCGAEARLDTVFWLAKPLLSTPGNDLRTELFARRVMAAIQASGVPPHLTGWGKDAEEMLIRYGWSRRWSLAAYPSASLEPPSLVGHDRPPAYWFFPIPADSAGWRWNLAPDGPRARYAPSYADRIETTEDIAVAVFQRGDSAVVVATLGPRSDTTFAEGADLVLIASAGPNAASPAVRLGQAPLTKPLLLRMAGTPRLVAIEARRDDQRRFLRGRRYRTPPPADGPLALSDPLFFRIGPELPATVEAAAERALPGRRIARHEAVGVYWEWTGAPTDSVDVAVAVVPMRRGLLGRVAQGLTIAKRRAPLTLQWRAGAAAGTEAHAVELDLSRLAFGSYELRLVATAGSRQAVTRTQFDLVR